MSSSKSANQTKDVMYVDIDDEITTIIDKVRGSDKKIVALVLPKRATVLQSVVNMKLLKRAATEAKKNLVLITSESGLMPLAGSVGVHVARNLNSRPEVPSESSRGADRIEPESENGRDYEANSDFSVDKDKTVGELSGAVPVTYSNEPDDADDTIELDDEDAQDDQDIVVQTDKPKKAKIKKFKIPNFNKFRVGLVLAVAAVVLLSVVGYVALAVMPKAKITIKTDSQAVNSNLILTVKASPDTQLDADKAIIPAQIQDVKKTLTQDAPATGQKNNGEKATGSVTMSAKNCSTTSGPDDVPAGVGVTTGGKTYITQKKASFSFDSYDGKCIYFKSNSVPITAQTGGAQYNVSSATFAVSGHSSLGATGSASGGTDDIIKIVTQSDIDNAKQKITTQDTQPITQELKTALIGRGLYPLDSTFGTGTPETTLSAEANTQADSVTVTQTIDYSMLGVKQDDLEQIIKKDVSQKIDTTKQNITNYGLNNAIFSLQSLATDGTSASLTMQTKVVAGAELNADAIKKQVAGKKAGDAKEIISANPGVTDVIVDYSPFWVSSIPKRADKITVVVQEPNVTASNEKPTP